MAKQKKDKRFPRVKRFLVNLFLGGNLFTLALLWTCCASTWINPILHPRIAVVGLAFPVLLLLNLIFIPLWLIYKPRLIVVPILGIALCGSYVLDYFPLGLGADEEPELRILTWNCHEMSFYKKGDSMQIAFDYVLESNADIICLQEFNYKAKKYTPLHDAMDSLGYTSYYDGSRTIYTRLPVVESWPITHPDSVKSDIIRSDVQYGDEILTIYCAHLESNKISPDDKDEYAGVIEDPGRDNVEAEVRYLSGKLSDAAYIRAQQVQRLLANVDSLPEGRSVILCGDFNDTPISYTYQACSRRFDNAFRSRGHGVGISFSERYFPVRIDNVFFSHDWECTNVLIDHSITASDHYPLLAGLKKRRN